MPASGISRAQENKRIRQEALREQLQAQGHVQHAVELLDKIKGLEGEIIEDSSGIKVLAFGKADFELKKYSKAFDGHMKLLNKYLPDLKATELTGTGADGEIVLQKVVREVVKS